LVLLCKVRDHDGYQGQADRDFSQNKQSMFFVVSQINYMSMVVVWNSSSAFGTWLDWTGIIEMQSSGDVSEPGKQSNYGRRPYDQNQSSLAGTQVRHVSPINAIWSAVGTSPVGFT
jgi:hypothetical protein